jgi:hypothetical protein
MQNSTWQQRQHWRDASGTLTRELVSKELCKMLERELTLYKFMWGYLRAVVTDIDEAAMGTSVFPGANPPVWILGHLAVASDAALRIMGKPPACSPEWHAQFAPGTNPANVKQPYPSKNELVDAVGRGYRRVTEAAETVSAETLNQPHEISILKATNLSTNGDVIAHLMSTHMALHVAQLSACRRHAGKAPIV